MTNGFCVWFTGLSGSGKTTLAGKLKRELTERRVKVEILDGDIIRQNLSKGLGFSREDRETNLRRIGFVARLLARNGVAVIVAAITPYQSARDEVRELIDQDSRMVEVFIDCPLETCIERDVKGLYKKALAGEIKHFTGLDDPFETPAKPDVVVRSAEEEPESSLAAIVSSLEEWGLVNPRDGGRPQPEACPVD